MIITADKREERSGVPFLLEQAGAMVQREHLPIGDYVVGPGAIVERKTKLDLARSLASGRLWRQLGGLRRNSVWSYLMIEGGDSRDTLHPNVFRGICIAATDLGIAVLRTDDTHDTACWLERLAIRRQVHLTRNRPAYAQRPKTRAEHPGEAILATVPSISVVTAHALLEHFGTVRAVVHASTEEWSQVSGMGPKRIAALSDTLDWTASPPTSHFDVSRNGFPST